MDFPFVIVEDVGFDLDRKTLDLFGVDFAFPTCQRQTAFNFSATEILACSVPLANLKQAFHPFVGGESAFAVIAKATPTNCPSILDQSRISHAIVIVAAEWASHVTRRVR
jgi:hypothetical protein